MSLLIAIDDTDNETSMGTGRLSRSLADELERCGLIADSRVTRHQLLVHPDIPYTSHNSSACIEARLLKGGHGEVIRLAKAFLLEHFHEGANPGLCVASMEAVPPLLSEFGRRAQQRVVPLGEGKVLARSLGDWDIAVWHAGETGQGCIGAMAAVGLRGTGDDGTYIGLRGIREITGTVTVGELLRATAIDRIVALGGEELPPEALVDTQDWIRPFLKKNCIILELIPINGHWRSPHKKKKKGNKGS